MQRSWREWIARGLFAGGVLALGFVAVTVLRAREFQRTEARRLQEMSAAAAGSRAGAPRARARSTDVIGTLEIPRVRLSAVVVEGVSPPALDRAVGHVPASALPGEADNVALAGHRDTWFRRLRNVRPGDRIHMRTPDGAYVYRVDSILVVAPDRVDLVRATGRPMLTLVTCYPFRWIGPAPRRWVVRAGLVGPPP